ncbi:hypothetical protein QBC38DRAFT_493314 [Podospora fimiseda]|uniref:Heterokaryon incompatibility domain-containing protein n=1 Tax=Podospora fimiseda TaxID=252190 RepID=A0AAN7BGD6_9PEZI|nr:hypothetical protein QBC38DRAFT_493314 [Podospora fimiseda]
MPELNNCYEKHQDCPTRHSSELPRRVLDVGSPSEMSCRLRLYQPERNQTGEYVALSYCWGPAGQNLVTTTSNIDLHLDAINKDQLPKAISDAI